MNELHAIQLARLVRLSLLQLLLEIPRDRRQSGTQFMLHLY